VHNSKEGFHRGEVHILSEIHASCGCLARLKMIFSTSIPNYAPLTCFRVSFSGPLDWSLDERRVRPSGSLPIAVHLSLRYCSLN